MSTTSSLITDQGRTETETTTYYEEKWEYGDDINAKVTKLLHFGLTTWSDQYIRRVKRTTIRKYLPGSKEPYSEEVNYEYGDWMKTGGRKKSNTLTSADDDAWFILAPGSSIGVSIPLDPVKDKTVKYDSNDQPNQNEADSIYTNPIAELNEDGFDFSTLARVDQDNNAQWVQGSGLTARTQLLGDIESPVNAGDIIIRPGVDILDVQRAGFGQSENTDFFCISPQQLRDAKIKNSPGIIPDDWDFLVITSVSDTRHSGSKEFSYSTLHTWVNSYKIER